MQLSIEEAKLRELIKEEILEVIQEKQDIIHNVFLENAEDLLLARAIEEGIDSPIVDRELIFNALDEQ